MKSTIITPTPNINQSLAFYKKLKYHELTGSESTMVSDGKVIIEINESRSTRPGIIFYKDSWDEEIIEFQTQNTDELENEAYSACFLSTPKTATAYLSPSKLISKESNFFSSTNL